ncbi:hypothetical protein BDV26DRAFT_297356 [Aspergillus bertholletiae]|uniref:NACHT domain-containing protein n=1 Tax=Aspergillus bertholletiae TaxID=1226010 RepID=A0A5N7AVV1_9EURO|nr:hypothetical protein BDV26DRAFT_297356 [Aspergillus bertholletiae]
MFGCLNCLSKKAVDVDNGDPPRPHQLSRDENTVKRSTITIQTTRTTIARQQNAQVTPGEYLSDEGHGRIQEIGGKYGETPLLSVDMRSESELDVQSAGQSDIYNSSVSSTKGGQIHTGKRDLWDIAESKVDEDCKKWLKVEPAQPIQEVLEKIMNQTKEQYKQSKSDKIEASKRNDGKTGVSKASKNILIFTLQAQELIKAAASFDPTGYASTAWSVVSFGLTLIRNDMERRDSVMEASEFLAGILSYHTIIDNNYRSGNAQSSEGLEDALVEVYIAILQYTAEAKRAEKENYGSRAWKSITALVEKPLQDLKTAVESKGVVVDRWKELVRDEDQKKIAEDILNILNEDVIKDLLEVRSRVCSKEELDILDWLSAVPYSKTQNNHQRNRSPDTGSWLLGLDQYGGWRATPGSILWLRGAVGCGKSVLCSTIIHDIEQYCQARQSDVLAYWYFQFSDEKSQYVENMVRCLIRQLAPSPLPDSIHRIWEDHRQNKEPSYKRLLEKYLSYSTLWMNAPRSLDFKIYASIDVEAHLASDVAAFVRTELQIGSLSKWGAYDPAVQKRIEERLLEIPERRFRWAELQVKRLQACHVPEQIDHALKSIPNSLEDSYRDILGNIDAACQPRVQTILTWLSFSLEPLTVDTVTAAASLPFSDSVIQMCTTALVTISADNVIRLAHFSVKEFLISEDASRKVSFFHLSAELAHHTILDRLLSELHAYSEIDLAGSESRTSPLLAYAAQYWTAHMNKLRETMDTSLGTFQVRVDHIFLHPQCFMNWIRLSYTGEEKWYREYSEFTTPLFKATQLGLKQTAHKLLQNGADPFGGFSYDEIFRLAAMSGYISLVHLLLDYSPVIPSRVVEIIIEKIDSSWEGINAVVSVIDRLWERGALCSQLSDGRHVIEDGVMYSASQNSDCGFALVKTIVGRSGRCVAADMQPNHTLRGALQNENPSQTHEILKLLFEQHRTELNLLEPSSHSLAEAVGCKLSIAKLCFTYLADMIKADHYYLTDFSGYANVPVMEALLQVYGEELLITDQVLSAAARNQNDSGTIRLLLKAMQPQPEISDQVLSDAAGNMVQGHPIMRTLLDECGSTRPISESIILDAVYRDMGWGVEQSIVKEFVLRQQAGFIVSKRIVAVAAAARGCTLEILQLLIANAAHDISITEDILSGAATSQSEDASLLMEYLLGFPESQDANTGDLLLLAAGNPQMSKKTISMLLDRSNSSIMPDDVFIAAYDIPRIMELLLDRNQNQAPVKGIVAKIGKHGYSGGCLELLMCRGLISVDEELVEMLAPNHKALYILSRHSPALPVTEQALRAAGSFESMCILLDSRKNNVTITKEVVESVINCKRRFGDGASALNPLFARFGSKVPITEDMMLHAATKGELAHFCVLARQDRPLNLQGVWEELWVNSCDFKEEASDILLEYTSLEISRDVVDGIIDRQLPLRKVTFFDFGSDIYKYFPPHFHHSHQPKNSYLERFFIFLVRRNIPLPQGRLTEIMMKSFSFALIFIILEHNPHIKLTEPMVNTAVENPDYYDLMWLFDSRSQTGNSEEDLSAIVEALDRFGFICTNG